jgi:hypothetical protein
VLETIQTGQEDVEGHTGQLGRDGTIDKKGDDNHCVRQPVLRRSVQQTRPTAVLCYPDRMNSRPTTGREVTYCGHRRPGHMKTSDQTKMTDLICKYCLKRGPPRRACTQCGRTHYKGCCTITTDKELANLHKEMEKEVETQRDQLDSLHEKTQKKDDAN